MDQTEQKLAPMVIGESLPEYLRSISSKDGSVNVYLSPYGGQVWIGEIAGIRVIYPLNSSHSISTDRRVGGNSYIQGETTGPGGTWLSFGGGQIEDRDVISEAPVHGPYSAPWNQSKIIEALPDRYLLRTDPSRRVGKFFREGEMYQVNREIKANSADNACRGSIVVATEITNVSSQAFAIPEAAEHTYYPSGNAAVIYNPLNGKLLHVEDIFRTAPENGNAIDTRLKLGAPNVPGQVVFLPEGLNHHVVVIKAEMKDLHSNVPINEFCIYRYKKDDPWTAIEPVIAGVPLEPSGSVVMEVSIMLFNSLDDYLGQM